MTGSIEENCHIVYDEEKNAIVIDPGDDFILIDDKIKLVISYREKYPETTMNELANIISLETETSVSKSCINHYFRKIKDLVNKDRNKE